LRAAIFRQRKHPTLSRRARSAARPGREPSQLRQQRHTEDLRAWARRGRKERPDRVRVQAGHLPGFVPRPPQLHRRCGLLGIGRREQHAVDLQHGPVPQLPGRRHVQQLPPGYSGNGVRLLDADSPGGPGQHSTCRGRQPRLKFDPRPDHDEGQRVLDRAFRRARVGGRGDLFYDGKYLHAQ